MGYELDQLLKHYGVSSPTLYNPVQAVPEAPKEGTNYYQVGATQGGPVPYQDVLAKYNENVAELQKQQAVQADYAAQYRDRLAATPMYGFQQFDTGPASTSGLPRPAQWSNQLVMPTYDTITPHTSLYTARAPAPAPTGDMTASGYTWSSGSGGSIGGFDNGFSSLGGAPDVGNIGGGFASGDYGGGDDNGNGDGYKTGGRVRGYAGGGEVLADDQGGLDTGMGAPGAGPNPLPKLSGNLIGLSPSIIDVIRRDAAVQGIADPVVNMAPLKPGAQYQLAPSGAVAAPVPASQPAGIEALLGKYMSQPSVYADELGRSRKAAQVEMDKLSEMLTKAYAPEPESSKAELYFRLAAALAAPTKTGGFMESVGKAAEQAAEYTKGQDARARESQKTRAQLALEAQKLRAGLAKDDVASVRQMAAEEMKDKRAILGEYAKSYIASGKPQSEAGKVAMDSGLQPGTPEYSAFVSKYVNDKIESGNFFKEAMLNIAVAKEKRAGEEAKKLTPSEVKLKTETEDTIASTDSAMEALKKAYTINPNTFDTSLPDMAQRKALELVGSKDERLLNTRLQENLLTSQALAGLKSAFGAAPTEGERKILLDIQGIGAKSREERAVIMKNAYQALQTARSRHQKRLGEIGQGLYRETGTDTGGGLE